MAEDSASGDGLDIRRKRARYRAWHRGTKEMDLIMGRFADAELASMGEEDIAAFERLIEIGDPELYSWVLGNAAVPRELAHPLIERLKAFHLG